MIVQQSVIPTTSISFVGIFLFFSSLFSILPNNLIFEKRLMCLAERCIIWKRRRWPVSNIEAIKSANKKDWDKWDKQIEADSKSGKLDFLIAEALEEKEKGTLKEL